MPSSVKLKKVPENLVYAVQGTKPILFGPENKTKKNSQECCKCMTFSKKSKKWCNFLYKKPDTCDSIKQLPICFQRNIAHSFEYQ